jgi:hypothetical protein
MTGKEKCKYLKEIRQRIADDNDIAYVTEECTHKGECLGTCPRCESELRYLERELEKRKRLGKRITVAGLAVGLAVTATGCDNPFAVQGNMEKYPISGEIAVETPLPGVLPETTVSFPGEIVEGEMVEYFPHISSVINDNPRVIYEKLYGIDARYLCDEWTKAGYYVEEKENNTYVYKYEDTVLELTYVDFETITSVVVRYADGSVSEYKPTPDKTTGDETTVHETVRTGELPPPVEPMGAPVWNPGN